MFNVFHRCYKFAVAIILGFLVVTFAHAESERAEGIFILDVDGSGEVDALTDGLLIIRSMFGFKGDSLTSGAVDLTNCTDCDSDSIDLYLSGVKSATSGNLNSYDDQNISGSGLTGTVLTIGIERGSSETVDLSSLAAGNGITSDQASAITANTAKTGISSDQATAITANTAKTGISSDQAIAITANTAKTGISSDQASAITANTAKAGISSDQAIAITANTAKTGITADQASAIAINSSDGFWAINFIHATGSDSDFSTEGTRYYQIYASKTMIVSKLTVKGANVNAPATIIGGIYRGTLGSLASAGGTLIGQGSRTSVDGLNEISLTAEPGESLNVTGFEPLIIALHVKTTSGENNQKQYFAPEVYSIAGDRSGESVSRSKNTSLTSLPSSPGNAERLDDWSNAKGFTAFIH